MKRKWIVWILAVLLCLQLIPAAHAGPYETSALCAYYLDQTLYAFAWLPEQEGESTPPKANLLVDRTQIGEQVTGSRLIDEKPPEYLILIDNSTSMGSYTSLMTALCAALFEDGRQINVTVATFGVDFKVRAEDLQTAAEVESVIRRLSFEEPGTDICGGIARGVDYMCNERWAPGELCQVIVLTDGTPYYSKNTAVQEESKQAAAAVLDQIIKDSPQVFIHLACLDAWDPDTYLSIKACGGIGLDLMAADPDNASFGGGLIAAWYDALYRFAFPLNTFKEDLQLRLDTNEFITIPQCSEVPVDPPRGDRIFDLLPAVIDPEDEPDEPTEPTEAPTQPPGETEGPEEPALPGFEPTDQTESGDEISDMDSVITAKPQPETENPTVTFPIWIVAAAGGVVLAIILVLILLLVRKRGRKKGTGEQPQNVPSQDPNALSIRVRVLTGSLRGRSFTLHLKDSLTLGSDARCELVLPDPGVALIHTRIFREGDTVMVEDLNSAEGTALNGMRLFFPNRLRSGDQLALGKTVLVVAF